MRKERERCAGELGAFLVSMTTPTPYDNRFVIAKSNGGYTHNSGTIAKQSRCVFEWYNVSTTNRFNGEGIKKRNNCLETETAVFAGWLCEISPFFPPLLALFKPSK
ncbi:hypothetical protein TNCV_3909251 [Trichonephila clavipes]|nr:hypothetical protein TNCV_3909251 [Trichonephila clavipes]